MTPTETAEARAPSCPQCYKHFTDGMEAAAQICGSLAETTYDDSDGFEAATGCEASIMAVVHDQRREQADIASGASLTPPAQSGEWRWVPVEPTEEMVAAGTLSMHPCGFVHNVHVVWGQMLSAIPDAAPGRPSAPTAERLRSALERIAAPMPGCEYAATERQEIARAALSDAGEGSGVADAGAVAGSGERLVEAAQAVINTMRGTYKARNGREVGIQGDDGEKCWIVHSDQIEDLRRALSPIPSTPSGKLGMSNAYVEAIATAVMRWARPHLKHMVAFSVLCEAIEGAISNAAPSNPPAPSDGLRALREALENLAEILEKDCDCPPCEGSDAPAEHWLGVAKRLLGHPPTSSAVRHALDRRKAVNRVLAELIAPYEVDVVKRMEIGNRACSEILVALDQPQSGEGGE